MQSPPTSTPPANHHDIARHHLSAASAASASTTTAAFQYAYLVSPVSVPSLDDLSEMTTEELHHLISQTVDRPFAAASGASADSGSGGSASAAKESTGTVPCTGLTDVPPLLPLARNEERDNTAISDTAARGAPSPTAQHVTDTNVPSTTTQTATLPNAKRNTGKRVSFDIPEGPSSAPTATSMTGMPALSGSSRQNRASPCAETDAAPAPDDTQRPTSTWPNAAVHSTRTVPSASSSATATTPTAPSADLAVSSPPPVPVQPVPDVDIAQAERDRWSVQMQDGWFFLSLRHLRWDVEWLQRGRQYRPYPIAARTAVRMSHTKSLCLSLNIDPELLGAEGWAADSDSDGAGAGDGGGGGGGAATTDPSDGTPLLPLFMWQFPSSFPGDPNTVLTRLSGQLEKQYDTLAPRPLEAAHCPNPRPTELGQALSDARREAGDGKVLFHYFARGMPPPRKGHLFLLNTGGYGSSPYVKMPLDTLRARAGSPLVMVADCAEAGEILLDFEKRFEEEHQQQLSLSRGQPFSKIGRPRSTKDLTSAHGGGGSSAAMDGYGAGAAAGAVGGTGARPLLPSAPVHEDFYFIGASGSSSAAVVDGLPSPLGHPAGMNGSSDARSGAAYTHSGGGGLYSNAEDGFAAGVGGFGRYGACTVHSARTSPPRHSGVLAGQLAAHPRLPSDMLTSCLTTPIRMALLWFIVSHPEASDLHPVLLHLLPGALNDKKTPLGALQWYFLCVSESVAWSVLPLSEFSRLYREDVYVAPLFRGFLLAERIIVGGLGGTVTVYPPMPPTYTHPLWDSWDNLVERTMAAIIVAVKPAPPTTLTTLEFREYLAIAETTWKYQQRELVLQRLHERNATASPAAMTAHDVQRAGVEVATASFPTVTAADGRTFRQVDLSTTNSGALATAPMNVAHGSVVMPYTLTDIAETSRIPLYALQLPVLEPRTIVVPNLLVEELRTVEALLDKVTRQSFVSYGGFLLDTYKCASVVPMTARRFPSALAQTREALKRALQRGREAALVTATTNAVSSRAATRPPLRPAMPYPQQDTGPGSRRLLALPEYHNTALSFGARGATVSSAAGNDSDLDSSFFSISNTRAVRTSSLAAGVGRDTAGNRGGGAGGQSPGAARYPSYDTRGFSPAPSALSDREPVGVTDSSPIAAGIDEAYVANPFTTIHDEMSEADAFSFGGGLTATEHTSQGGYRAGGYRKGNSEMDGGWWMRSACRAGVEASTTLTPQSPMLNAGPGAAAGGAASPAAAGVDASAVSGPHSGIPFIERMPIVFQGLLVLAHRDKSTELVCRLVDCGPQGVLQCAEANVFRFVLDRYWIRADLRYLMPATLFIYTKSCYADPQLIGSAKQLEVVVRTCVEVLQCPVDVPTPESVAATASSGDGTSESASTSPAGGDDKSANALPPGIWQHSVLGPYATATGQRLLAISLLTIVVMQCDGGREVCSRYGVPQLCGQLVEWACEKAQVSLAADYANASSASAAASSWSPLTSVLDALRQPSLRRHPAMEADKIHALFIASSLTLLVALLHDLPLFQSEDGADAPDEKHEEAEEEREEGETEPMALDPLYLPPLDGTVRELEATTSELLSCVLMRIRPTVHALLYHPIAVLRGVASRVCQMILLAKTPTEAVKSLYVSILLRRLYQKEMPPFESNTDLRLQTTGAAYAALKWMLEQLGRDLPLEEIGVHVGRFILEWSRLKRKGVEPAAPYLDEDTPAKLTVAAVLAARTPPSSRTPLRSPSPSSSADAASPAAASGFSRRGAPPASTVASTSARGPRFYVPPQGAPSYRPPPSHTRVLSGSYVAHPPVGSLARSIMQHSLGTAASAVASDEAAAGVAAVTPLATNSAAEESSAAAGTCTWRLLAAVGNLIRLFAEHTQDGCPYVRAHARKVVIEELAPLLHVQWFDTPQSLSRGAWSGAALGITAESAHSGEHVTERGIHGTRGRSATTRSGAGRGARGWTDSDPHHAVTAMATAATARYTVLPREKRTGTAGSAGYSVDDAPPPLLAVQSLQAVEGSGDDDEAVHLHHRHNNGVAVGDGAEADPALYRRYLATLLRMAIAPGESADEDQRHGGTTGLTVQESAYDAGKASRGFQRAQGGLAGGGGVGHSVAMSGPENTCIRSDEGLFNASRQGRTHNVDARRTTRTDAGLLRLTDGNLTGTSVGSVAGGSVGALGAGGPGLASTPPSLWPESITLYGFSKQDDSTVREFVWASLGYLSDLLLVPLDDDDAHHPYNLNKARALRHFESRVAAGLRASLSTRLLPDTIGSHEDRDAPPSVKGARVSALERGRTAHTPSPPVASFTTPTAPLDAPASPSTVFSRGDDRQARARDGCGSDASSGHLDDSDADGSDDADDRESVTIEGENQVVLLCRTSTSRGHTGSLPTIRSGKPRHSETGALRANKISTADDTTTGCAAAGRARSPSPLHRTRGGGRQEAHDDEERDHDRMHTAAPASALPTSASAAYTESTAISGSCGDGGSGGVVVGTTTQLLFHPTEPLIFGCTDRGYGLTWRYEPATARVRCIQEDDSLRPITRYGEDDVMMPARVGQIRLVSRYRLHHVYHRPQVGVDPRLVMRNQYALGGPVYDVDPDVVAEVAAPRLMRTRVTHTVPRHAFPFDTEEASIGVDEADGREETVLAMQSRRAVHSITANATTSSTASDGGVDRRSAVSHGLSAAGARTAVTAHALPSGGGRRVCGMHLVDCATRPVLCAVQRNGAVQLLCRLDEGGAAVHVLTSFETQLFDVGTRTTCVPLSAYQPCSQQLYLAHEDGVLQAWDLFAERQTNLVQGEPYLLSAGGGNDSATAAPTAGYGGDRGGGWSALTSDPTRPSVVAAAAGPIYLFDLRQQQSQPDGRGGSTGGGRHYAQAFASMHGGALSSHHSGGGSAALSDLSRHLGQPLSTALCMSVHFSSRYPHLLLGGYAGTSATNSAVVAWDDRMLRASQPLLWYPATPSSLPSGCRTRDVDDDGRGGRGRSQTPVSLGTLPNALHSLSVQGSSRHLLTLTTTANSFALVESRLTPHELSTRSLAMAGTSGCPPLALRGVQQHRLRGDVGSAALHPFQPLIAVASEDQLLLYGTPAATCW